MRQSSMGASLRKSDPPHSPTMPVSKLEARMVEALRWRKTDNSSIRSFNSILLKFPKIDRNFRNCKSIFDRFDENSNGTIDLEELRKCYHELNVRFSEEEIVDLFGQCDINEDKGINFSEFIVLLCLLYLLKHDPNEQYVKLRMEMAELEATFETLVDAFLFLDKNKDGYVSKTEMVQAVDESGEQSSGRIAVKRFEEMDYDKNGMVNFKEFLFAFVRWVGIDDPDDDEE